MKVALVVAIVLALAWNYWCYRRWKALQVEVQELRDDAGL